MKHAYCLWPLRNLCDKNLQQLRGTFSLYCVERETWKKKPKQKETSHLKKIKFKEGEDSAAWHIGSKAKRRENELNFQNNRSALYNDFTADISRRRNPFYFIPIAYNLYRYLPTIQISEKVNCKYRYNFKV